MCAQDQDRPDRNEVADLVSEVRSAGGDAMRAEAEQLEHDVTKARLRARDVRDLLADLARRGDEVQVRFQGGLVIAGRVDFAGKDYMTVTGSDVTVDVRGSVPFEIHRSPSGGAEPSGGALTFVARLRELELTGEPITLVSGSVEYQGRIATVATDHVILNDNESEWVLALGKIDAVVRSMASVQPPPPERHG